jgi:hypothetical protein
MVAESAAVNLVAEGRLFSIPQLLVIEARSLSGGGEVDSLEEIDR